LKSKGLYIIEQTLYRKQEKAFYSISSRLVRMVKFFINRCALFIRGSRNFQQSGVFQIEKFEMAKPIQKQITKFELNTEYLDFITN
jgi:hypothetical protein